MSARHSRLIILGSCPAVASALAHAARANLKPTLIAGLHWAASSLPPLTWTTGRATREGLTGPALMERMQAHANASALKLSMIISMKWI